MYKQAPLVCHDNRPCFAKAEKKFAVGKKKDRECICKVLLSNYKTKDYEDGACPFCKPEQEVTNGKTYKRSRALYR